MTAVRRWSSDEQQPRGCSAPGCAHVTPLQCALLRVATGGVRRVRVHRGKELVDEHDGLWTELEITVARLGRVGTPSGAVGRSTAETGLTYHQHAAQVAHRLANTVTTWARDFAETHHHLMLTATNVTDAARWMAAFPTLLNEHPAADEMWQCLTQVLRDAERVIDRSPDRVYCGPCDSATSAGSCDGQLYARRPISEDDELPDTVRCRLCRTEHLVAELQDRMSRRLAGALLTAPELAPVLSWRLGKPVKVETIRCWRSAGRLTRHTDASGRPLYRYREVEALAAEAKPRNTGRRKGAT